MKRLISLFLVSTFIMSLLYSGTTYARRKSVLDFFEERYLTKAYVSDVVNSSGMDKVDTVGLKKDIENALASRRSHKFEIVNEKTAADIIINIELVEYLWTEDDPVDVVFPFIATAADMAKSDHYARMVVIATIVDAKKDSQLWKKSLQSTVTHATMTEEESYGMSNERMVEIFLRSLFRKPKRR